MCMGAFPTYICMYHLSAWCLPRPEKGVGAPGTRFADGCELPYECCKSDLGPLKSSQSLSTESNLQPCTVVLKGAEFLSHLYRVLERIYMD